MYAAVCIRLVLEAHSMRSLAHSRWTDLANTASGQAALGAGRHHYWANADRCPSVSCSQSIVTTKARPRIQIRNRDTPAKSY